ncbi:MAG: ferredoxin [Pseudomonadota bacterium]
MPDNRLSDLLAQHGLQILGACPDGDDTLSLIGPDEPAFWAIFTASEEYHDGRRDPLDRWSQRIVSEVAVKVGGEALFPFGGPPYQPFYTWAMKSGRAWPSPIGFLVHDRAGLFVSFRGAIRHAGKASSGTAPKPCDSCAKPCATACPVGAFDDGYDVEACKAHVRSDAGRDCRNKGCLARRACPVGQGLRLPAQAQFHMEAFL